VTCAAAAYVALPASLKVTTHSPAPVKVTLPELSEQPLELLSRPMLTLSLEVACAWGVYVPWSLPADGADPTVMVFDVVPAAKAPGAARALAASVTTAAPTNVAIDTLMARGKYRRRGCVREELITCWPTF
jgi:hypothetical protein